MEYAKAGLTVSLPKSVIVFPRQKPIPKEKPMTKWERFRQERGLPIRAKRGRMIYDAKSKDWVPRWGPDSLKKREDKLQWVMESKNGEDPYQKKRDEKKLNKEKEKLKEMKNVLRSEVNKQKDNNQILPQKKEFKQFKKDVKEQEKKAIQKQMTLAAKSTASQGHFDRKLKGVNQKEIDQAHKYAKQKEKQKQVGEYEKDKKQEKNRNLKILNMIQRQK